MANKKLILSAWEEATLTELGIIKLGKKTHKPASDPILFENGTIPFVQVLCVNGGLFVNNIEKYYNEIGLKQSRLFSVNTVCITNNSNIGDTSILKEDSCLADTLFGFNSFENVSDSKFVKYCFDFSKIKKLCQQAASANTGTKSLTKERLSTIPFPKPPLDIQQKIGRILSTYDLLIENYEKQIDLLKNQRTKLFQRWFIDHKFPNYIGTNPSNWKSIPLKDFVSFKKGKKLAGDATDNGLYPLFSASIETKKINEYSFNEEALLLSLSGKIFVKYFSGKFEATSEVCILSTNKDKILWLFEVINFQIHVFNCAAQGTGLKHLSTAWLKNFEIDFPPDNLIKLFNQFAEPVQKHIDSLSRQVNNFQIVKNELIERIYSQNLEIN